MENILIVEDESIIALELQARVKNFGYQVAGIADRGSTAINKFQQLKPDIILMDINIKGDMDGIETAEKILKYQKVPIIFITAFSDSATRERIKKANASGLLFKPFSDKELQATIDLAFYKFKMEMAILEREEALRESEELFKTITQSSLDVIYIIDKKGTQLFFNDRLESMLGYKPEEIIGKRFTRFIPHQEIPKFAHQVRTVYANKFVSTFTSQIYHKEGHPVDVEVNGKLAKHKGELVIQGTIRDITARVKAQELLIESEKSYLSLFNSVNESIYIHGVDGVFINVNEGAVKMYGHTREDLIGKTPVFVSAPGKNDMNAVVEIIKNVYDTGQPATFEFWGLRKNGEIFPKEVVSNKCKYFGKDVIISTARDITDRKKTEEALKKNEDKYRQFLYLSLECIYMFDVESGKIVDANDAFLKLLDYNLEETKELTAYDIIAHDHKSIDSFIEKIMKDGPFKIGERNWRHKDGHIIPMEVSSNKMKVGDKDIIFIVAHDISELKEANEKLRNSEQLYQGLVETSQDLIWQCDNEARYVYLNPACEEIFEYKPEEMIGKMFTDFQTPENAARDIETFKQLLISKNIRGYESIHQSKSGKELKLIFNAKTITNSAGEIVGTQGTAYRVN